MEDLKMIRTAVLVLAAAVFPQAAAYPSRASYGSPSPTYTSPSPPHAPTPKGYSFNSASSPTCWDANHTLSTDWYMTEPPNTGVTREFWWSITEGWIAPDGVRRWGMTINGAFPGPLLEVNWGDTVAVHVTNSLSMNGTSIHWHGIRQYYTNSNDGVVSITQCPLAPGHSMTYYWKARQYGTSWYHSHYGVQAWNGVMGAIKINGPASAPYDVDLGPVSLHDWYHTPTDILWGTARSSFPPPADNGLINGLNVFGGSGKRWETEFEAGKTYRLRFINMALDTHYHVMLDGHQMTVIAADFVPVKPYTVNSLPMGIGQRYDVLITANQPLGNYWLRAIPSNACSAANLLGNNIRAIVRYEAGCTEDPTSRPPEFSDACDDLSMLIEPAMPLNIGHDDVETDVPVALTTINGLFTWLIRDSPFQSDWGVPTVQQVVEGNLHFTPTQNVVEIEKDQKIVYFVIRNQSPLAHPIHLHGHDFFVLAQSNFPTPPPLKTTNPMRRDVAMLPAGGSLVIAFFADNPGVWLMHCHIGWHTLQGLALQVVERSVEVPSLYSPKETAADLYGTCHDWNIWDNRRSCKLQMGSCI